MLIVRRLVSLEMVKARGIVTGPRGGRYYAGSERRDPKTGRTTRQYVGQETGTSSRWSEDVRDPETGRDRRLPPEGHGLVRHYRGQEVRVVEHGGTFTVHVDGQEVATGRSLTGALSKALGRAVSGYSFMRLGGAWDAPAGRDWGKTEAAARALHEKIAAKVPDAKIVVEHRRGAGVRAHVAHPNGERYVTDMDEDGRVEGTWRLVGESGRKWERVEGKVGATPAAAPAAAPVPETKTEPRAEVRAEAPATGARQRLAAEGYGDVGEKIGGARKDLAALRAKYEDETDGGVTLDDLGAIEEDPAFARSLVTRERHFGTRTEQAESFRAQGMTAGAGYLTHRLLSAIDAKPADSPTARRQFVQAAERLQSAIRSWRTTDDVAVGMKQIQDEMRGYLYTADEKAALDKYAADEKPLADARDGTWREFAVRRAVGGKGEKANIDAAEARFKAADEAFYGFRKERYPAIREMQRAASARAAADPNSMANILRSLGDEFAGHVGGYLEGQTPGGRSHKSHSESRNEARRKAADLDRADDWSWGGPRERPATPEGERKQARKFTREPEEDAARVGPATKPYAAQTLLDDFRFRGAEYGNWVDSTDAREHTQRAGEALADMAHVLGLESHHVSLNGRLGLAFGARGSGWANAHYETGRKVINLTRTRGGGTLAHEWGHALDNVLAMVSADSKSHHTSMVTESGWQPPGGALPARVTDAFRRVGEAIYNGDFRPTQARTIKAADVRGGGAGYWPEGEALLRKHGGDAQKAAQEFADSRDIGTTGYAEWFVKKTGQDITIKEALTTKRARKRGGTLASDSGSGGLNRTRRTTEFAATAKEMGTYWSRPAELFARAFETFMYDELAAKGRASPYLVSGVSEARLARYAETHGVLEEVGGNTSIWPRGTERARINDAMRELVAALRETGTMQKALRMLGRGVRVQLSRR